MSSLEERQLDPNPYESPSSTRSTRWVRTPSRLYRTVVAAFLCIVIVSLFIPTVSLRQGGALIGRLPLWAIYLGLLTPNNWAFAAPLVAIHLSASTAIAFTISRLANRIDRSRK